MTTVITYGTFDLFHVGHVNLLKRAQALGDRLIVAVSTDEFNESKGKVTLVPYEQRVAILEACRYVDLVIPESSWEQKRQDIAKHEIDTFVMGNDWQGKFDDLSDLCEVVYLDRTKDISSSAIKQAVLVFKQINDVFGE
ncbi:glycerol-3-phosphate cytidylyltransferase [Aliidiomarina taiwanensis]|uniref:Glycerol-3-phosphate cytidylyltransferase n=1 Tax=Aliidiomarina taiwanensis TaxID=946228 RepID=A0A432X8R9_9GAMM|nr:glycerol-3-phosphate cytidylyltransferase [Aliidiomarina taiwanensis]RUO43787.1 glycerol-3-phosphate cytidylyltransferase [Aliidiomarina taiwanensis]